MDAKYLAILQLNKATIHVNMLASNHRSFQFDMKEFYTWIMFLVGIKLEAAYHSDIATCMVIYDAMQDEDFMEQVVIEGESTPVLRDNIGEIRKIAGAFNRAICRARFEWH